MVKVAIVKTGGKQYLAKVNDFLVVDHIDQKKGEKVKLETLAVFDEEGKEIVIEKKKLKNQVEAEIIEHGKGEKVRVARFKAKVRYRKVKGFRPLLTKIKIIKI